MKDKPGLSAVPPANEMSWNCLDPDGFSRSKEDLWSQDDCVYYGYRRDAG